MANMQEKLRRNVDGLVNELSSIVEERGTNLSILDSYGNEDDADNTSEQIVSGQLQTF